MTFLDPGTNTKVTKRFYAGAPAYPVYTYRKGVKTYQGVAVDLDSKIGGKQNVKRNKISIYEFQQHDQWQTCCVHVCADPGSREREYQSITVQDRDLYEANRAECRKDIEAFNQIVYAAEDERVTGGTADETEK